MFVGENRCTLFSVKNLSQLFVRFLSAYVGCSFSVSFHQCSIIILILILLLSEGAGGEAQEPSQKTVFYLDTGELHTEKFFHTLHLKRY